MQRLEPRLLYSLLSLGLQFLRAQDETALNEARAKLNQGLSALPQGFKPENKTTPKNQEETLLICDFWVGELLKVLALHATKRLALPYDEADYTAQLQRLEELRLTEEMTCNEQNLILQYVCLTAQIIIYSESNSDSVYQCTEDAWELTRFLY